jgi:hypothetical protein
VLATSRRTAKPLPRISVGLLSINHQYASAKYIGLREFAVVSTINQPVRSLSMYLRIRGR